jgi:glycosyltransferase involved in cell wall biosynthesis
METDHAAAHRTGTKRVLMICYYYPPVQSSGTIRSLAFSQHLRSFSWEPLVLTAANPKTTWLSMEAQEPEGIRVERSCEFNLFGLVRFLHGISCRIFRCAGFELRRNYFDELLCLPDSQIAWSTAWKGTKVARRSDLIYVSCAPFSSAVSGCLIKWLTGKPLVIDFRDAWTLNPHITHTVIHKMAIEKLEQFVIAACDALILNTSGAERLYRDKYPAYAGKMCAIPNGYDQLNLAPENSAGEMFTIMHVGSFYGSRQPDALLEALCEINRPDIEFVQIGGMFPSYERYNSRLQIRQISSVSHEQALALMKTASVLYLKQGHETGIEHYIAVAAKTYEYIATGLPIIAECPAGDNTDIVQKYAMQRYIVTDQSKDKLKAAVLDAYAQRRETRPSITEDFITAFSRKNLTQRLAALFDSLTNTL